MNISLLNGSLFGGNIFGSVANVSSINATFGNIANVRFVGGNVEVSGQVDVLGNVVSPFFIGNGSQLTGIAAALPGVIAADINGNLIGSFANVSNIIATFGNVANVRFVGGNVAVSGQVNVLGNMIASNFLGNIIGDFANIGNTQFLGGNVAVSGQVDVFGNVVANAFIGNQSVLRFDSNAHLMNLISTNVTYTSTMLQLLSTPTSGVDLANLTFIECDNLNGTGSTLAPFAVWGNGSVDTTGSFNVRDPTNLAYRFSAANSGTIRSNVLAIGTDVANFQAINGSFASTMLTLQAGRTPSSAFNFFRCQNSNGTTLSFVIDGAGNATARHFFGNMTGSVGNVANVRFLGGNIAVSGQVNVSGNIVTNNHFLGNFANIANVRFLGGNVAASGQVNVSGNIVTNDHFLGNFANIANVRFLGGNVAASGQVNVSGNMVVASNGIMSGLYLSSAGTATSNNNIFFSSTGNINDNNVNAIGWNGSQVRHSTIGGSSGYTFTQYVASLVEQTEVANLNYFGGSAFKCNGVAAFGAQVININTGFTGTMVLTESSTASAGTFHHIRCKSTTANVFRVVGNGTTFNVNGTYTTGADYAEFFEWADGNLSKEDRRGTPVVLNGNKIRIASQSDDPYDIIGVVSTNPTIVGDSAWNEWSGVYIKDKYGQSVLKTSYYHANVSNSEEELVPCSEGDIPPEGYVIKTKNKPILNPSYDPSKPYINRIDRPEWAPIGLCGKLRVDNNFVTANVVHPSWKTLRIIDDPAESGNAAAQVVEMLVGVPFAKPDKAMQDKINSLEETVNMLKKALNI
ncbi:Chlorovirus glycoprotein repeat domain-containing protein [Acanthocystis turfacea Chlorella virus MO0605SPH]|nr:Chlorovirus glycoprotein repeat domain-containing protein [Acanthocystis turfacea Chlorella virus MO0605SPH]